MSEQYSMAALAAAQWWADKLLTPPDHRNGDALQSALGSWVASVQLCPTPEQVATFAAELARLIDADTSGYPILGVDYGPCPTLSAALTASGIKGEGILPWKTIMYILDGVVSVREGYGAPSRIIYPSSAREGDEG